MSTVAVQKKLSEKEKEDLLKEVLGQNYATSGNNLPVLKSLIDRINRVDYVFTLVELIPIINKILSIRAFSILASGSSVISIFLIPVSALLDIINAYQTGRRMYSYRAIAYAITAWAFGKPIPISSQRIILNAQTLAPKVDAREIIEYGKAWKKASQDAVNKLNEIALRNNIPKDALKVFLRVISDNNEQKLCETLLKGFETQLGVIELRVWKTNYTVRYPS